MATHLMGTLTGGLPKVLTYASSAPAVATAVGSAPSYDLQIDAISPGTATITATYSPTIHTTITVTVTGAAWVLDSISGATSGTWTDAGNTLIGSLTFNPPTQVSEGVSYPLSTSFNATLTTTSFASLRWAINVQLFDITPTSYQGPDRLGAKFITANPTVQDTVTVSSNWVLPAIYGIQPILKLQAVGFGDNALGIPHLIRTAYYHKVTP